MKALAIGVIIAVCIAVVIILILGGLISIGFPSSSPSPIMPSAGNVPSSPEPSASPPAPGNASPSPSPNKSPTGVKFQIYIAGVSGSFLSRTVTAQIGNTGTADAHNVSLRLEAFSQGGRIALNGEDYVQVDIGTLKAGEIITREVDISVGLLDGLKISRNGVNLRLTILSDEATQEISYDWRP